MDCALDQQVVMMEWYDLLYLALMQQDTVQLSSCGQCSLQPLRLITTWDDPGKEGVIVRNKIREVEETGRRWRSGNVLSVSVLDRKHCTLI